MVSVSPAGTTAGASTYTLIATYTVTGSAIANYTFSSIPQTYTDLFMSAMVQGQANGDGPTVYFNGNNTSTYFSNTTMYTDGITAKGSTRNSNQAIMDIGTTSGLPYASTAQFAPTFLHVANYTNTNTYKTGMYEYHTAAGGYNAHGDITKAVYLYSSTAAITSITVGVNNGKSIPVGSVYSLYGIKAA